MLEQRDNSGAGGGNNCATTTDGRRNPRHGSLEVPATCCMTADDSLLSSSVANWTLMLPILPSNSTPTPTSASTAAARSSYITKFYITYFGSRSNLGAIRKTTQLISPPGPLELQTVEQISPTIARRPCLMELLNH